MSRNLKSFKRSISFAIFLPLVLSAIISSVLFYGIEFQHKREREQIASEKLRSAIQIFQSSLSEQLAIIASSTVFTDFITSGEFTRKQIMPQFLAQLSTLKASSVIGIKIWRNSFNVNRVVFDNGSISEDYITLKLCYVGNRLDREFGSCNYFLRLYFSNTRVINEFQKINNNIQVCDHCKPFNLFSDNQFGNFNIDENSGLVFPIAINDKDSYVFYYYLIMMAILLFLALYNSKRIHHLINKIISQPIENLVNNIKENQSLINTGHGLSEINYLIEQIEAWKAQLELMRIMEKEAAIGQLTAQLAHDIRSPLTALEMSIQTTNSLPEDIRILIRNAVWRIRDIANSLLFVNKKNDYNLTNKEIPTNQLLSNLINTLIVEKRVQYKKYPNIKIENYINDNAYGLFSIVSASCFQRMLSNLVDNAVEALDENGEIAISLISTNQENQIIIEDNGKGIPNEILNQLGRRGFSHDKTSGSGLGIYHAKKTIESYSGRINIESKVHQGTRVSLFLPKSSTPNWFVPQLNMSNSQYLVVIDDDSSIHEVWKARINDFAKNKNVNIYLISFYNPNDIRTWFVNKKDNLPILYFCDYEFLGYEENGLDLICSLNIIEQSVLVTNRFDDPYLIEKCENLQIKIIPKELAKIIPIKLSQQKSIDAVLIDDDVLVHTMWNFLAKKNNKELKSFFTHEAFLNHATEINVETPIYIDSHFGDGVKGEEIAKEIYYRGFHNLYLTTGYKPDNFKSFFYFKDILDKKPPF